MTDLTLGDRWEMLRKSARNEAQRSVRSLQNSKFLQLIHDQLATFVDRQTPRNEDEFNTRLFQHHAVVFRIGIISDAARWVTNSAQSLTPIWPSLIAFCARPLPESSPEFFQELHCRLLLGDTINSQ